MTDNPHRALEIAIERANARLGAISGDLAGALGEYGACYGQRRELDADMPIVRPDLLAQIKAYAEQLESYA